MFCLFVCLLFFVVVVVRAGTYYFLRLCTAAPYLQEKIVHVGFPEVFVVEGSEAIYFLCMFYQKHSTLPAPSTL